VFLDGNKISLNYTVEVFVFEINISIKVTNHSLPDIAYCLYEHFACFDVKNSYLKSAQAL
jgi:hypothetical protein